MNTLYGKDVGF